MTWSLVQNAKKSVKKILELIRELTKVKVKLICINKLYHYILKINIWKLKFERQYHLQQHQKYKNRAKLKKMQSTQNNMGLNCVDPLICRLLKMNITTALCDLKLLDPRVGRPTMKSYVGFWLRWGSGCLESVGRPASLTSLPNPHALQANWLIQSNPDFLFYQVFFP